MLHTTIPLFQAYQQEASVDPVDGIELLSQMAKDMVDMMEAKTDAVRVSRAVDQSAAGTQGSTASLKSTYRKYQPGGTKRFEIPRGHRFQSRQEAAPAFLVEKLMRNKQFLSQTTILNLNDLSSLTIDLELLKKNADQIRYLRCA